MEKNRKEVILNTTYDEFNKHYEQECRFGKIKCSECLYQLGGCCLGDVLDGANGNALRDILREIDIEVE